ncbi:hypothetical protein OIU77_002588 [Salix suchowensis]|uniref:AN1-type domain-containing protein n=1 Tax=Salix suchowensis TaxID=1278906 RepID=A0ABQ9AX15_9ROSI|nr:hypothetical protein OIU77_002588 [Salix suchowensis]
MEQESQKRKLEDSSSYEAQTRQFFVAAAAEVEGQQGGAEEKRPVAAANRCNFCRKKMGLTGFKCRCGHMFCSQHRYSDKHNCVFDYKSAGQDAIAKANPVVKADKIDKI